MTLRLLFRPCIKSENVQTSHSLFSRIILPKSCEHEATTSRQNRIPHVLCFISPLVERKYSSASPKDGACRHHRPRLIEFIECIRHSQSTIGISPRGLMASALGFCETITSASCPRRPPFLETSSKSSTIGQMKTTLPTSPFSHSREHTQYLRHLKNANFNIRYE